MEDNHHSLNRKWLRCALWLAIITVFYNIVEGLVAVYFGWEDETLSLFGFGLDSFVEVVSGIGIWHMVVRIQKNKNESPDRFEKRALRITGTAFYFLSVGLLLSAVLIIYYDHDPVTTSWGIVVSAISILTMWILIRYKKIVGKNLKSDAIIADANCTRTCLYLSVVLLVASAGYELTQISGIDAVGSLIIAWISLKEGRESFEKAEGKTCCSHSSD